MLYVEGVNRIRSRVRTRTIHPCLCARRSRSAGWLMELLLRRPHRVLSYPLLIMARYMHYHPLPRHSHRSCMNIKIQAR